MEKTGRGSGRRGRVESLVGLSPACLKLHISLPQPPRMLICTTEHTGRPDHYVYISVNNVKRMSNVTWKNDSVEARRGRDTTLMHKSQSTHQLNSDEGCKVPVTTREESAVLVVNEILGLLDDSYLLVDEWKRG